ncbi:MAG: 50S ribosomal protein L2 [Patescibacteria group bacterium]
MAVKIYKPTTPARRKTSVVDYSHLDKTKPLKKLTVRLKRNAGRNVQGKITIRHRGGGAKKIYRQVDFKREKYDQPAKVLTLEYDPNRTAFISLVEYKDGERRYVIAPDGLKKGDVIISSKNKTEIKMGNRMPLKHVPPGLNVYNIELTPGRGGAIVRSAGTAAILQSFDENLALLKLPSTEIRKVSQESAATLGQVSNIDKKNVRIGKAGRMRHMGVRPTVRGKAMNPVDHPHGGGEGSQPIGLKHPKTPWGKPALGRRTRRKGKMSSKLIVKRRAKRRRK